MKPTWLYRFFTEDFWDHISGMTDVEKGREYLRRSDPNVGIVTSSGDGKAQETKWVFKIQGLSIQQRSRVEKLMGNLWEDKDDLDYWLAKDKDEFEKRRKSLEDNWVSSEEEISDS